MGNKYFYNKAGWLIVNSGPSNWLMMAPMIFATELQQQSTATTMIAAVVANNGQCCNGVAISFADSSIAAWLYQAILGTPHGHTMMHLLFQVFISRFCGTERLNTLNIGRIFSVPREQIKWCSGTTHVAQHEVEVSHQIVANERWLMSWAWHLCRPAYFTQKLAAAAQVRSSMSLGQTGLSLGDNLVGGSKTQIQRGKRNDYYGRNGNLGHNFEWRF